MFDPQTVSLIRAAPTLPALDRDRLPENLTKAFASIVAFRLELGSNPQAIGGELLAQLDEFRRLAATYECLVVISSNRPERAAAAFVAAQAYHLLYLAKGVSTPVRIPTLSSDAITSELSALLLFLIADQTSDAIEMAKVVEANKAEMPPTLNLLSRGLIYFARGQMALINPLLEQLLPLNEEPINDIAVNLLYRRLLEGLAKFARFVLNASQDVELGVSALTIFREVQALAVLDLPSVVAIGDEEINQTAASIFAGPHHLASLLIAIADHLGDSAVSAILPPPGGSPSNWYDLIQRIVLTRPFLWPNHLEAIREGLLKPGLSAVISFPTGAGKTTLSELKIAAVLALGGSVIYLAPTHALVGQVKNSLKATFSGIPVYDSFQGEDYYAETGEFFGAEERAILVMTPERCLALLSGEDTDKFERVGLVIFDEFHLIHPRDTGQNRRSLDAMLAVLSLTKSSPKADWLMLSAMVANSFELAGWFQELTGRPCITLNLNWKPTRQARGCLLYESSETAQLDTKIKAARLELAKRNKSPKTPPTSLKHQMQARPYALFCLQQTWQSLQLKDYALLPLSDKLVNLTVSVSSYDKQWQLGPNKNEVAAQLAARCVERGLKVLLFTHSPIFANSIAENINEILQGKLPEVKLDAAEKRLLSVAVDELGNESSLYPYRPAACHHGLLLPAEREMVETLFRRTGGIMALSATPTLAQGINLPADVVFIVGDERFDAAANQSKQLDAHEILNAAGRAGRAGHVAQGIVIVLPQMALAMDSEANKLPSQWFNLQKAIFSQADGCLQVSDPVTYFLDRVQDAASTTDPENRYFLQRIPRDIKNSETNAVSFFSRTLAAFQAKKHHELVSFREKIKVAVAQRRVMEAVNAGTWREELAFRTGVASEFIAFLDEKVSRDANVLPDTTEGLIIWLCDWLRLRPEFITGVFAHRLTKDFYDLFMEEDGLFGNRFVQMTVRWIRGDNLADLNKIVKKPSKNSKCQEARKFVRIVPDIAFTAGLVTKIRRKQMEGAGLDKMPISLAVLSLCVRLGLDTPELAALKIAFRDEHVSRRRIREIWEEAQGYAEQGHKFEKFSDTRDRVNEAVTRLRNIKGEITLH